MAPDEIKSLYMSSMKSLGVGNQSVVDESGDVIDNTTFSSMLHESLWLPRLALKAVEISHFIFHSPCFDVAFKYDKSNASGFSLAPIDEEIRRKYGYPIKTKEISKPILQRLVDLSIGQSISFGAKGVFLKDHVGLYDFHEGDEYLRPLDVDGPLSVSMWMSRLPQFEKAYERVKQLDIELEMKP